MIAAVSTKVRALAVGVLWLISTAISSAGPLLSTLVFQPAPPPAEPDLPPLSFSIPKYRLSPLERETVAACLVLEAANQGEFGQRAVMSVIRNRACGQPELFSTIVLQQKQFSALNRHTAGRESLRRAIDRARSDPTWSQALAIVDEATGETWHDPTDGATHYTRTGERTAWTRRLARTTIIGAHSFYR